MLIALLLLTACGNDASEPKQSGADTDSGADADSGADTDSGDVAPAFVVTVTPDAPTQFSDLTCTVTTPMTNPDGSAVTYAYAWSVDGMETAYTDAALPETATRPGETWTCRVATADGALQGATGQHTVTLARGFEQIALGSGHACGLAPDHRGGAAEAVCWGSDLYGEASPVPGPFTHLVAGYLETCGVREDATLACWGTESWGMNAPPEGRYVDMALGWYGAYALDEAGSLTAWAYAPEPPAGTFRQVAAGEYDHCALTTDGQVTCWGSNVNGEGDAPAGTFTSVTGGYHNFCALGTDGLPACWGFRSGLTYPPDEPLVSLSSGELAACGLRADGTLLCWGGVGEINDDTPAGVYARVSVGGTAACALDAEGRPHCWGHDVSHPPAP
jgi:hypothetical protein